MGDGDVCAVLLYLQSNKRYEVDLVKIRGYKIEMFKMLCAVAVCYLRSGRQDW